MVAWPVCLVEEKEEKEEEEEEEEERKRGEEVEGMTDAVGIWLHDKG